MFIRKDITTFTAKVNYTAYHIWFRHSSTVLVKDRIKFTEVYLTRRAFKQKWRGNCKSLYSVYIIFCSTCFNIIPLSITHHSNHKRCKYRLTSDEEEKRLFSFFRERKAATTTGTQTQPSMRELQQRGNFTVKGWLHDTKTINEIYKVITYTSYHV